MGCSACLRPGRGAPGAARRDVSHGDGRGAAGVHGADCVLHARLSAAVWRCGGAPGDRAAHPGLAQSWAGATGRGVAAAAAPADAAVCTEAGVVAERAGGRVAVAGVLCAQRCGVLSAVPTDGGAALGVGGDGVLRAESEPAVSGDDGDDGAAVFGAADLGHAADGGVRGRDPRGPTIASCPADDLAWRADLCGGVYALRRMGAGRGGVVRGEMASVARAQAAEARVRGVRSVYATGDCGAGAVARVQPALQSRSAGLPARALLGPGD